MVYVNNPTDTQYLKETLHSANTDIRHAELEYQFASGEYNTKIRMLNQQIKSIEKQLKDNDDDNE